MVLPPHFVCNPHHSSTLIYNTQSLPLKSLIRRRSHRIISNRFLLPAQFSWAGWSLALLGIQSSPPYCALASTSLGRMDIEPIRGRYPTPMLRCKPNLRLQQHTRLCILLVRSRFIVLEASAAYRLLDCPTYLEARIILPFPLTPTMPCFCFCFCFCFNVCSGFLCSGCMLPHVVLNISTQAALVLLPSLNVFRDMPIALWM